MGIIINTFSTFLWLRLWWSTPPFFSVLEVCDCATWIYLIQPCHLIKKCLSQRFFLASVSFFLSFFSRQISLSRCTTIIIRRRRRRQTMLRYKRAKVSSSTTSTHHPTTTIYSLMDSLDVWAPIMDAVFSRPQDFTAFRLSEVHSVCKQFCDSFHHHRHRSSNHRSNMCAWLFKATVVSILMMMIYIFYAFYIGRGCCLQATIITIYHDYLLGILSG